MSFYSPPPSASSSTRGTSTGIQLTHDTELLIQKYLPVTYEYQPVPQPIGIPLPICIPQITPGFMQPIARGYNQVLNDPQIGISQEDFLRFLDGLNMAMTASPPLRVVDVVGMGIGFVPYHWAMIAGIVIQTSAKTAMHVLAKTISDRYLRAANQRLFKPKGLTVRICTTAAMMALITSEEERKKTRMDKAKAALNKTGRIAGVVLLKLPIPFSSRIVRAIADPAPHIAPLTYDSSVSGQQSMQLMVTRRLKLVEGHALPLDLNVPPPSKPEGVMEVMNSWAVKYDTYKGNKREEKRESNRRLISGGIPQTRREAKAQRKYQRKLERRNRRNHVGLLSSILGPKESRLERNVKNSELLEHWGNDSALWVVVMNADNDEDIAGIEIAESLENEEEVDDVTLNEIIKLDEEELRETDSEDEEHLEHVKAAAQKMHY